MHNNNYVVKGDGMRRRNLLVLVLVAVFLFGCSHIDFNGTKGDNGLTYYEPVPYLFVAITKECVTTTSVITLPGKEKVMKFVQLLGSSEFSVSLSSSGTISSVGQKSDTKLADVASFATAVGALMALANEDGKCSFSANLYPIIDGKPQFEKGLSALPK